MLNDDAIMEFVHVRDLCVVRGGKRWLAPKRGGLQRWVGGLRMDCGSF